MLACLLSVALFGFWLLVGETLLRLAGKRRGDGPGTLLVAPVVGLAATLVPVFWCARLGWPVELSAGPLTLAWLVPVLAVLVRDRAGLALAVRRYAPFGLGLIAAMAAVGWPLVLWGFDWLSFGNDDMANYVLGANRLMHTPFFAMPSLDELKDGSNVSSIFWTLQAIDRVRTGSELTLAWLMASTGLDGAATFMPAMVALHAVLVSAVAGLVLAETGRTRPALAALVLVAVSPLTVFSTLSQLIGQVGGLCFGMGALVLLREPWRLPRRDWPAHVLAGGLVLAALLMWYPEISPFVGLGLLLHLAVRLPEWRARAGRVAGLAAALTAVFALGTGSYALDGLRFLWIQFSGALPADISRQIVFSYYLVPSGLPTLWGLQPLSLTPVLGYQTVFVVVGALLSAGALCLVGSAAIRGRVAACVTAVMVTMAGLLLARTADFGLFKLAMFIQPFLIAALVPVLAGLAGRLWQRSRRLGRAAALAVLPVLALQGVTTLFYVRTAADLANDAYYFTLKGITPSHFLRQLSQLTAAPPGTGFATDAQSVTMAKLVSHFTHGHSLRFLSASPFLHVLGSYYVPGSPEEALHDAFVNAIAYGKFHWHTTGADDEMRFFPADRLGPADRLESGAFQLIRTPGRFSVVNGVSRPADPDKVEVTPIPALHNYLVFKPTRLGGDYFAESDFTRIAFWPVESDYFFPGRRLAAAGRHLVFRVLNPDPTARMVVEMSTSQGLNGRTDLPPAAVVGDRVVPLGMLGHGSARLVSEPVGPQESLGERFIGIDMGVAASPITAKGGFDPRWLVGMVRDVSLISDEDYKRFAPPRLLSAFPADLGNRQLEYSGLYEDGWVSERAFVRLAGSAGPATLLLDLEVPRIGPASPERTLIVLADGQPILHRVLSPGAYWLRAPLPPAAAGRRIELRFSATESLPKGDGRPIGGLVRRLGWGPPQPPAHGFVTGRDRLENTDLDPDGMWADGWLARRTELTLAGGPAATLRLTGLMPLIADPQGRTGLTVTVNGTEVGRLELSVGAVAADLPLPASTGPRRIGLAFSAVQRLPAPDRREAGLRLDTIEILDGP